MKFASDTSVSVARSRGEIEDMVQRAGGLRFASMYEAQRAVVLFELHERRVMFELPLPTREDFAKREVRGKLVKAEPERQQRDWEQACRTHWRALCLCIKAKLVSVESGVESFEEAFLAHIVVNDGGKAKRFAEVAIGAIRDSYTGQPLRPMLGSGS